MYQIIKHFTDDDLYTFTCMYYILKNYPTAQVRYNFFDRNNEVYPIEFKTLLQEQVDKMKEVIITEEEIAFMKKKCYYLPEWFFDFLRGFRYNPKEVHISQDKEGHLSIQIEGPWYKTIKWEMMLLATISELSHYLKGENTDSVMEIYRASKKAKLLADAGCRFADMGTRRRFSFTHHNDVIEGLISTGDNYFTGTSNVYLAMKYDLTPIGTMSHQIISAEEVMSGVFEANYQVMKKWQDTYHGYLGLYLYDCFGEKAFFNNVDRTSLMMFDGVRVDSGDEKDQITKLCNIYSKYGINHQQKTVCLSNALNAEKAIEIHKWVNGAVKDTYGIGTWFTCNFDAIDKIPELNIKNKNIVIKLTGFRYSDRHDWHDCIKLSNDKGKTLGNEFKCSYLLKQLS